MPFQIIRNDITRVKADAIVNTANPHARVGGGTDSAVYKAAGWEMLLEERKKIGDIPVGEVAVTPAFSLPAKYIIHTVGPAWIDGRHGEYDHLASCYRKSLLIAEQLECESIAFPLISTGTYGFPKGRALQIALRTISEHLRESEIEVILVVFDRKAYELSSELTDHVRQYIDDNYVSLKEADYYHRDYRPGQYINTVERTESPSMFRRRRRRKQDTGPMRPAGMDLNEIFPSESLQAPKPKENLDEIIRHPGEGFQECLFRLIDERKLDDPEVYRKANISRKLFSKIRCNSGYTPGKKTVLALAVALELNLDQTTDLLSRAGLAFSPGNIFDLIVKYCIENRTYDIYEINALLFEYDQPLLGNTISD